PLRLSICSLDRYSRLWHLVYRNLSFNEISGRLVTGTTRKLLNIKGRLALQHAAAPFARETDGSSWNYPPTPSTLLNLQGINLFSKKLGSLGGFGGITRV